MDLKNRDQQSVRAVNVGLITNILLAIAKTVVGILGHSPALLADGINSTSDAVSYLVVAVFVRRAGDPPDYEHPYGHRQLESIAALIVGSFVITAAVAILWNSITNIYELWIGDSAFGGAALIALWVALFTVALKLVLTIYTQRIGEETKNAAITALAYDHRNDLFAAIAVAIGIFLGRQGILWIDPLAGAVVALFVLRTGVEIIRESSYDLMDTVPGQTLADRVTVLVSPLEAVEQIEEIHAHRFGPYLVINLTIGIDGTLSVAAGDEIASQVEETLYKNIELLRRVYVHYHPSNLGAQMNNGPKLVLEE